MRIAIVIDYSLDLIGGAQRAALNEAAALVAAGHEVVIVGPRPSGRLLPDGFDACWTTARHMPGLDFPLVVDDRSLRRRLARVLGSVDGVHLHSEFAHAAAASAVARRLELPILHTIHTAYWPALPTPLVPAARAMLARLAGAVPRRTRNPLLDHTIATARASDIAISPSAHQAADLAGLGVDAVVLPNCGPARAEATTPLPAADALRIAWIGRCVPEKRLVTFIRGVREARRRLPAGALEVAVAGDGPMLPAARLLGTGIAFLGRLGSDDVRRLIDASHLTALTSHGFDNQPMTVVESIRAGRPVLHTDPRLTEGLDRAGLLTPTPDASGIADLLVDVALDRRRIVAAAAGACEVAGLFAPETHVARLLGLLTETPVGAAA